MRKKVIQLLNGVPIAIYSSIGSAVRKNNLHRQRLQNVLHGRAQTYHGYGWRFATDAEMEKYGKFHAVKNLTNV